MRLTCKRAHAPYPGVRIPHGLEVVIEPDWIAEALVQRGYFDKAPIASKQKKEDKGKKAL